MLLPCSMHCRREYWHSCNIDFQFCALSSVLYGTLTFILTKITDWWYEYIIYGKFLLCGIPMVSATNDYRQVHVFYTCTYVYVLHTTAPDYTVCQWVIGWPTTWFLKCIEVWHSCLLHRQPVLPMIPSVYRLLQHIKKQNHNIII